MKLFLLIHIIFLSTCFSFASNDILIEPPNWWTGMKNEHLQLLIHAPGISNTREVTVNSDHILIEAYHKLESYNYLFIDLRINPELLPGSYRFTLKNHDGILTKFDYEFQARRKYSEQRKGFDSSDVIYLLMPDRFSNGNEENDDLDYLKEGRNRDIQYGRHGGDIQGIIDHLDYLEELGITGIWSTPLLLDDEASYSYHSYAISDYYNIDPRYGSNEDYRLLAEECHHRGIKLIMDMVPNHCAASHWWMDDLPQEDWIHQSDEFTRSNHRKTTINDPYVASDDQKIYSEGWFDITMPDLNQSNEFLLTYLTQNAIWWVEYAHLDGLRVDTYLYNDKWSIAKWTGAIRTEYPDINIVGECWQESVAEMAYWQSGVQNYDQYDSQLPSIMDFQLNKSIQLAFNEDEQHWDKGVARLYNTFAQDYLYANPLNLMIFGDNHDMTRMASTFDNDIDKFKLAFSFLLTTRGIPQIYYGSEIMMPGDKSKGDGDLRHDFPGAWSEDERNAFNASGRTEIEESVFQHIRTLLQWRKQCAAIHFGDLKHFVPEDNLYVYFRVLDRGRVMVVLNNNQAPRLFHTKRYRDYLPMHEKWRSVLDDKVYENLEGIVLPPKTALILEMIQDEK